MTVVFKSTTKTLFPQSYTSLETLSNSINSNLRMLKFRFNYIYLGLHICQGQNFFCSKQTQKTTHF